MTQRTFSCFISFSTDQLWAPFIHCELFYNQLFHGQGEKHLLGFILMPLIRFSLGIRSDIMPRGSASFGRVSIKFSANRGRMNSELVGNKLLSHSCNP
jgi:hypothetical protein